MKKIVLLLVCLCSAIGIANAQVSTIKGTVTSSEDGQGVIGASVIVTGTNIGAITDFDGSFTLNSVPVGAKTVTVSCIGMSTKEIPVAPVLKIVLDVDSSLLDDVVVIAYGTARKESLTGAVSTVKNADIAKRPVSSVASALEGASAGVMVNSTYGEPGSDPSIRIRGFGSINGTNAPLYVIDGVPFGGSISDLNPEDIESLTVLKDASSAALYGNRASNGVILITTKRAKSDRVLISASVKQGIYSRGIPEYDRLNADEFMETMFQGYANSLMTSNATKYPTQAAAYAEAQKTLVSDVLGYNIYNKADDQLFDANGKLVSGASVLSGYDDLDWYKYVERLGHRQEYNVSGQGATQRANFLFSGGYLNEKGYVTASDFERWSGRAKVDVQPVHWIKAGLNVSATAQTSNNTTDGTSSYANPFMYCRSIAPIYPVFAHDPSTGEYILDANGDKQYDGGDGTVTGVIRKQFAGRHIVWERSLDMDQTKKYTINGQAFADIHFLKDFTLSIKGDVGYRQSFNRSYNNSTIGDGAGQGRAKRVIYAYSNYTFQQLLNWNHNFNGHEIEALVGHENYSYNYTYNYQYKTGETFPQQYELINFAEINSDTGYTSGYTLESYLARVKYNYLNKYFAEASFRRDGSSRFSEANRWGNFWSLGGSWIISKEDFMKNISWIDSMKLRASYGEVGNDQSVGYYEYMALYSLTTNGEKGAAYLSQNENPDIRWESANTLSVALEGRLFDRFNFNIEYFDKTTKDLLFDVKLPISVGSTGGADSSSASKTMNIGSIANRGIELTFDADIIQGKNFNWNVGLNATFLKNKILTLPEEDRENGIISGTKKYVEGGGIYDFWMYQFVGVDQMTGNSLYLIDDENYYILEENKTDDKKALDSQYAVVIDGKEYTTYTTYAKKDWAGTSLPTVFGSFNTSFRWKNFSLSALFTYSLGGKCLDYSYQSLMQMSGTPYALHKDILKSWSGVPDGMTETSANRIDPNGIPVVDFTRSTYNNATSTRFLHDASYLVIKNIALNYNFPKRWIQKANIQNLSVSLAVDNLATFTSLSGMNPQQGFNGLVDNYFNTARVFSLGVNLTL